MLWTTCPVQVTKNRYGSDHADVTIPDRNTRSWSRQTQQVELEYAKALESLNTEFVILFTELTEVTEQWLAQWFKNGLVVQYPFNKVNKWTPQVHIYPLVLLPWFKKKYWPGHNETDPILLIDGKSVKWTEEVCFDCKMMLDRSMKQCGFGHESCIRALVSEKTPPTKAWNDAHKTIMEADAFPAGLEYRPIKKMMDMKPFESFTIHNLTTDEARVKQIQQERSDAASLAAQSKFVRTVACKQCFRRDHCYDFRFGGNRCGGLCLAEDYDYIHKKCEPWMAHVMLLTQHESIDSNLIRAWTRARTTTYVLRPYVGVPAMDPSWYEKYKTDLRCVVLMRNCKNNPATYVPYRHVCKLLNVQPVSKWSELPLDYKTSKSLRAIAYGLASRRIHSTVNIGSGWHSRSVEVVGVEFVAGKYVTLVYDNNRRSYSDRYRLNDGESFYSDLLNMPDMSCENKVTYTGVRLVENSVFRAAVIDRRFNVTIDEVKEACRKFSVKSVKPGTHPPLVYEWLEERSKERCRQKRRSSKQPASLTPGDQDTATSR
jgi:hypothetical protein